MISNLLLLQRWHYNEYLAVVEGTRQPAVALSFSRVAARRTQTTGDASMSVRFVLHWRAEFRE